MPGSARSTRPENAPLRKAAEKLARQLDPDPDHAFQVRRLALGLFDATRDLHGLGKRERPLLEAAALLHDSGWTATPSAHHKGSRDVILQSDLPGLTREALEIVACVARYHRKAHPDPSHKIYRGLDDKARSLVERLAAILRLADGLDRSHGAAVEAVRVERRGRAVRLLVTQPRADPADVSGAMRKRALFEEVFRVTVEAEAQTRA